MRKLHFVQAIRGLAASMVVVDHAMLQITAGDTSAALTHVAWTFGQTGVDTFFVVSGFIMTCLSWDDFERRGAAASFLWRRLVRIVPLYWLATLGALAYHKIASTHGADDGWWQIVCSLAFIPYRTDSGEWFPILPQGWTLTYELIFYAVFAAVLVFRRSIGLPLACLGVAAGVLLGGRFGEGLVAHLAASISLWFVLGIALGAVWCAGHLVEPRWLSAPSRWFGFLGDASYSTYLVHGMLLTMLLRLWQAILGPPTLAFFVAALVTATLGGIAVHVWLEMPLQKQLRNRSLRRPSPGVAALR
jgi:peptidoglycan/LPS O-acetylase OafA/YrhL